MTLDAITASGDSDSQKQGYGLDYNQALSFIDVDYTSVPDGSQYMIICQILRGYLALSRMGGSYNCQFQNFRVVSFRKNLENEGWGIN